MFTSLLEGGEIGTVRSLKSAMLQVVELAPVLGVGKPRIVEGLAHAFHQKMGVHRIKAIDIDDASGIMGSNLAANGGRDGKTAGFNGWDTQLRDRSGIAANSEDDGVTAQIGFAFGFQAGGIRNRAATAPRSPGYLAPTAASTDYGTCFAFNCGLSVATWFSHCLGLRRKSHG